MKTTTLTKGVIIGLLLLAIPTSIMAQPASVKYRKEAYVLESGEYAGLTDPAAKRFVESGEYAGLTDPAVKSFVAFRQTVRFPAVPWLQLHFGEYNLGNQSYITVTSLKDGHKQSLDAKRLRQWQDSTAYFNGDAVEVELHVAAGEKGIFVRIKEISVGELASNNQKSFQQETISNTTDNRVASDDHAVGRILPAGCTGFIVSNGAHLTAGHCVDAGMQIIQFNVPASNPDGTINNPPPQHQYPIIAGTIMFANNGRGDDWAVFGCGPNANTGLLPAQAQGAFFRMWNSAPAIGASLRITGYGEDGPGPPDGNFGNSPPRNADNQTQQTRSGPNRGLSAGTSPYSVYLSYYVFGRPGDSGSPIIDRYNTHATGIHNNSADDIYDGDGTVIANELLYVAISRFPWVPGTRHILYVDNFFGSEGGSTNPYRNVTSAVKDASYGYHGSSGDILSIVTGNYPEALTITKRMTLTAPVGPVIIGN